MPRFKLLTALLTALSIPTHAQQPALTVEKIMQAPVGWVGTSPSQLRWAADGNQVYFSWNPTQLPHDSLYVVSANGGKPTPVTGRTADALPAANAVYDAARRYQTYARHGDIFLLDLKKNSERRVTLTAEIESQPAFLTFKSEPSLVFRRENNLFRWDAATGLISQLTDLRAGAAPAKPTSPDQRTVLTKQQLELFDVLRERDQNQRATEAARRRLNAQQDHRLPKPVYIGGQEVEELRASPDGRYVTYRLATAPGAQERVANVPAFVTTSGYTEDLPTRSKVGDRQSTYRLGIYDAVRDSAYLLNISSLPGLHDVPAFQKDYPAVKSDTTRRDLIPFGPVWSRDGQYALLSLRSVDNKDRWLTLLNPLTGRVARVLDRQHDEAWINGPGIGYEDSEDNLGWVPGKPWAWFISEATGYSHLYVQDVANVGSQPKALTSGQFEVQQAYATHDGRWWYLRTNQTDPGESQLYRLPIGGGKLERLTPAAGGYDEITFSPDEQSAAALYSTATKPWELVTFDLKPNARVRTLTHSPTAAWEAYPWREPEIVTITARDGVAVRARLYRPAGGVKNGAAVIFVHGAGYLQNAHRYWSHYFREYMFHNLLAERGYTVLDVDYRGSAGYGRDFRTGIYRHMGGKDLDDQVDAAKWLTTQQGVDAQRIGIYGGSYGGFITLMALFTQPDVFACGAALRSVTDWAHYNHGYTSNILNTPQADSLAYRRSSPIYFAAGLKKPLLICHGMVDTNVHFSDVVRLSQRLIELHKKDWELAVYPVESHAFTEPSSWTDEYSRILKLFEENLVKR